MTFDGLGAKKLRILDRQEIVDHKNGLDIRSLS